MNREPRKYETLEVVSRLISNERLRELCKKLGYRFRDNSLLITALCHASFSNERPEVQGENNEKLEFLGDAVLELVISHLLMERFEYAEEGELSRFRAAMVDEGALYQVALTLGLGDYLLLGRGEEGSRGREKPSILADAMEAILGAIYLDGGFEKAKRVIERLFLPRLNELEKGKLAFYDYKTLLQELTQQRFKTVPSYRLVEAWGPAHDKTFRVALSIKGETIAEGEGKSKKEAEQKAATKAYKLLRKR
ncbi:MAG TPA: ribonuclease III [Desulfobacterales bacterium]|nr:ribonuclease III [Desulfobacterales bacterium]